MDFSALLDTQSGVFAQGLAALSGVCAFICVFLPAPTERSGVLYRLVYGLLNWIGCNKGKAKNAALVRILQLLLEGFRDYRRQARTRAVRSGPADQWLQRRGGTDKRPAPGSGDAGSPRD